MGKWQVGPTHPQAHRSAHAKLCISLEGLVFQPQGQILLRVGRRRARDVWDLHEVFGAS